MMSFVGGRGGLRGLGDIVGGRLVYVPDLASAGSGPSYFPRDVENDAEALGFLGFLTEAANENRTPSMGSQSADVNNTAGAWDPAFRSAVTRFQVSRGLTNDGWIGPKTRAALAVAVTQKNLNPSLPLPPPPGAGPLVPINPGSVPAKPAVIPGVTPASATSSDDTLLYVGIGAGVLGLGGLAWYALK